MWDLLMCATSSYWDVTHWVHFFFCTVGTSRTEGFHSLEQTFLTPLLASKINYSIVPFIDCSPRHVSLEREYSCFIWCRVKISVGVTAVREVTMWPGRKDKRHQLLTCLLRASFWPNKCISKVLEHLPFLLHGSYWKTLSSSSFLSQNWIFFPGSCVTSSALYPYLYFKCSEMKKRKNTWESEGCHFKHSFKLFKCMLPPLCWHLEMNTMHGSLDNSKLKSGKLESILLVVHHLTPQWEGNMV